MSSGDAETIYERVAKLEDEVATLRSEVDVLKKVMGKFVEGFVNFNYNSNS